MRCISVATAADSGAIVWASMARMTAICIGRPFTGKTHSSRYNRRLAQYRAYRRSIERYNGNRWNNEPEPSAFGTRDVTILLEAYMHIERSDLREILAFLHQLSRGNAVSGLNLPNRRGCWAALP